MSVKIELSETQKSIVNLGDRPICVKASAGSGKTRVLTERVRYLLNKTKKQILALTFTHKAGEEVKERLNGISMLDKRVFVGTFHGFCQKALKNHGYLIGLEKMPHIFENENDRLELIEQAINLTPSYENTYRNKDTKDQKKMRYQVLKFIAKVKRNMGKVEEDSQSKDDEKILLYQNYQDILSSQNGIDFDDLLILAHKLFIEYPNVADLYRRSFYAICIDEAQDLNNAQYQFLLALTGCQFDNVMMVGDPNQSIFHFNGSSPKYMTESFIKDFNPEVIELEENYRSSQEILFATKKIFPTAKDIPHTVKKGIFELQGLEDEEKEAKWIIDKINELISMKEHKDIEGQITYEKIAILARNKYLFSSVDNQLKSNNIPFYYKMRIGSVQFESDLINMFDLAFKVKLNPQDKLHKGKLLEKLESNISKEKSLEKIISAINNKQHKALIQLVIDLYDDGSNLKNLLTQLKDEIVEDNENERNMIFNDIDDLISHWHKYAKTTDTKSLQQFKNAMALGQTHQSIPHKGITLSTIHTMKGQEFDIVFLMGMDDETFPDYRAIQKEGIDLKQEENNLYVAFTRSKRFLYVTWPKKRRMPWGDEKDRKISRFLKPFDL